MRWPTESSRLRLIPKAQVGDWRRFCRCSLRLPSLQKALRRRQNTLLSFHDPRDLAHARRLHTKQGKQPAFSAIGSTRCGFDKMSSACKSEERNDRTATAAARELRARCLEFPPNLLLTRE